MGWKKKEKKKEMVLGWGYFPLGREMVVGIRRFGSRRVFEGVVVRVRGVEVAGRLRQGVGVLWKRRLAAREK